MSYFRRKAQPFALGLLLGIVIAGTFFTLRLHTYFRELNFYRNFATTFLDQQSKEQTSKNISTKIQPKKPNGQNVSQTVPVANQKITRDSLPDADSLVRQGNSSENIVIRKDELLNIRTVELCNLNPPIAKSHTDSLLEKVSEIKDGRNYPSKQSMQIEFWKSPLNYKGYKLSKYNVILYGLSDTQNLKVFTLDNIFYIKYASVVYKLDYNSDFKPFERVLDEAILSNFK